MSKPTTKTCITCKIEKEITEFGKEKKVIGGLRAKCKDCYRAYARNYYVNHQQKILESNRASKAKRKPGPKPRLTSDSNPDILFHKLHNQLLAYLENNREEELEPGMPPNAPEITQDQLDSIWISRVYDAAIQHINYGPRKILDKTGTEIRVALQELADFTLKFDEPNFKIKIIESGKYELSNIKVMKQVWKINNSVRGVK